MDIDSDEIKNIIMDALKKGEIRTNNIYQLVKEKYPNMHMTRFQEIYQKLLDKNESARSYFDTYIEKILSSSKNITDISRQMRLDIVLEVYIKLKKNNNLNSINASLIPMLDKEVEARGIGRIEK